MDFKGKKITVVGLGRSGLSASLLLYSLGAKVKITEEVAAREVKSNLRELLNKSQKGSNFLKGKSIEVELGMHTRKFIEDSELVIISPGVKMDSRPVKWARQKGIKVIGEIELGCMVCNSPIIAITGTNGKSSVATLIGKMLKNCGKKVVVCGNIGRPFTQVLSSADSSFIVLEVSSYQLESIDTFRPYIAVVLNIAPDHMDRYASFVDYKNAKAKIFKNQTANEWAVLNCDDKNTRDLRRFCKAKVKFFGTKQNFCNDLKLDLNSKACLAVAKVIKLDIQKSLKALSQFKGLPHRIEYVKSISNIEFINDSKSTNPSSTIWALSKIERPIILLAGGFDKNLDFSQIKPFLKGKVKHIVAFGKCRDKISRHLKNTVAITKARQLKDAVFISYNLAKSRDTVLLSPMAASFDEFVNFEHRGDTFKKIVKNLKPKNKNKC